MVHNFRLKRQNFRRFFRRAYSIRPNTPAPLTWSGPFAHMQRSFSFLLKPMPRRFPHAPQMPRRFPPAPPMLPFSDADVATGGQPRQLRLAPYRRPTNTAPPSAATAAPPRHVPDVADCRPPGLPAACPGRSWLPPTWPSQGRPAQPHARPDPGLPPSYPGRQLPCSSSCRRRHVG